MSHNLHNVSGWLIVGIDVHLGIPIFPPIPTIMPEINFLHPFILGNKIKPSILFDGVPAVAHTHTSKLLWPHLSLGPFDILSPVHVLLGKQRCCMPRMRVVLEGEPAACCLLPGPESINTDCWIAGMIPSSYILNFGTVVTDPDAADFLLAAKWLLLDNIVGLTIEMAQRATHMDCGDCPSLEAPASPWDKETTDQKLRENIERAMALRDEPFPINYYKFYQLVKSGAEWDYKSKYPNAKDIENFGNYHFGIVAAAAGFDEQTALRFAGAYQIYSGTSKFEYGMPWDLEPSWASSYGDDPTDTGWIQVGYDKFYCLQSC